MNTDVAGRVRNVQLPTSKPLLPLFEAIINSIQAIEDSGAKDGRIEIEVLRDPGSLFLESDRSQADITGFVVRDNGIGFDDRNFEAFTTSDTTFKASRGGKGIGRFMWLAAFDHAEIESVFQVDGRRKCRRFIFNAKGNGIEDASCVDSAAEDRATVVRLVGFSEKYQIHCPKRLETIAAFIVEEFLEYFIGLNPPVIVLRDGPSGETISLEDFFERQMASKITRQDLTIKDRPFEVLHVRLYSTHINEHRLYFCAHGRAVAKEKLLGRVPNLVRYLRDENSTEFIYAAYVNSPILEGAVNPDRTAFNRPEDGSTLPLMETTLSEIRNGVLDACKSFLAPYTAPIEEKKRARIEEFVHRDGVMYRPILDRLEHTISTIDPEATDDEIDRHLYDGYHELQVKLRDEGQRLLERPESDEELAVFEERFERYFEEISEVNRADLARYVCHRKAIIEFLRKQLSVQEDGKYHREDRIHSIIFPRGKTSDEVLFEDHNLWLVDERLVFHLFLSSDKPIKQLKVLESPSKKEPDIIVFDKAFAFSETREVPFSSITIIEFKKPQRNDYSETENPFTQVAKYIDDIRGGKARTPAGRPIPISPNLPFYCYIICDITPTLKEWARLFELQDTPDCLGFFGYKRGYCAYFEVISYSKLAADAEKRNKVFFQKLGL